MIRHDILKTFTREALLAEFDLRAACRRNAVCWQCGRAMWSKPDCGSREHSPMRTSATTVTCELRISGPRGCGKSVVAEGFRRVAEDYGCTLTIEEVET